jgi:plasmid stabilization system protein ParE
MKTLPVLYSPRASEDIDIIKMYILGISKSISVTENYLQKLRRFCHVIGLVPHGGFPYRRLGRGVRGKVFKHNYIVVYRVSDDHVLIDRIISGRRNLRRYRR